MNTTLVIRWLTLTVLISLSLSLPAIHTRWLRLYVSLALSPNRTLSLSRSFGRSLARFYPLCRSYCVLVLKKSSKDVLTTNAICVTHQSFNTNSVVRITPFANCWDRNKKELAQANITGMNFDLQGMFKIEERKKKRKKKGGGGVGAGRGWGGGTFSA